jgi:hypothetical protein
MPMKSIRPILLIATLAVAASVSAQVVDFVIVEKVNQFRQDDATTASEFLTNNWKFRSSIEGSGMSNIIPTPAPTLSLPGTSTGSPLMTYVPGDNAWVTEAFFTGATTTGKALMDAAYNNGTYTINAFGATTPPALSLTSEAYPNTPIATATGAGIISFTGGILTVNPGSSLMLTTNTFSGFSSGNDHVGLYIWGNNDAYNPNDTPDTFTAASVNYTINAGLLTAGNTYTVEMMFDNVVGSLVTLSSTGSAELDGAQAAAVFSSSTTFTIQAIPEPSAYAAIFGVLALAGAKIARRRRTT